MENKHVPLISKFVVFIYIIYLQLYENSHHLVSSLIHSIIRLFNFTNLVNVKLYITVVLIWISRVTNEFESLFKWLWTICIFSSMECLFVCCAIFFSIELFIILMIWRTFSCILDTKPLLLLYVAYIGFQVVAYLFKL